jgi:hypothetical protein
VFTGAALADAPPNDTFAGATPITSLPYSTTEDTTQATLDSSDSAAGSACGVGGFQFGNSVWFSYKPTSDQLIQIDTSGSSYGLGIGVVTGSPTSFNRVACSLGGTAFSATAGTTYYIDLVQFGATGGGTLNLSLRALPDPISEFTVDSSGTFDKSSGSATVTGKITCSSNAYFAFGSGQVATDAHGRNAAIGEMPFFGVPLYGVTCDGTSHQWSLTEQPQSGLFKGGPVTATVSVAACTFICASRNVTQTVTLKQ